MPAKISIPIIPRVVQIPTCAECSAPMRLIKIGPYRPKHSIPIKADLEERTFECSECLYSENWIFTATQAASVGGLVIFGCTPNASPQNALGPNRARGKRSLGHGGGSRPWPRQS